MEKFHTRTSLARAVGIDHRNKAIEIAKPIGEIVIGGKLYPVYDKSGIELVTKQIREQKEQE